MKKKIVIIGGGFAGVNLAKHLQKHHEDFQITLVDKNNYNFFPPLLYKVATGFLDVSSISYPFRRLFRNMKSFNFLMAELVKVVPKQNTVVLFTGELQYDHLFIATGTLSAMGVTIKLNTQVKDFMDHRVYFADGTTIETTNLIWTAGVTAQLFEGISEQHYGRGKRLLVDKINQVAGLPNMFAIGDTCLQVSDVPFPSGHPQVAQIAIQQGANLAVNLSAINKGKSLMPFAYNDKGSMAIIGRNRAVTDIPKPNLHLNGFLAWLMWLLVHLMSLVNIYNKLKTLYNWMVLYQQRPIVTHDCRIQAN